MLTNIFAFSYVLSWVSAHTKWIHIHDLHIIMVCWAFFGNSRCQSLNTQAHRISFRISFFLVPLIAPVLMLYIPWFGLYKHKKKTSLIKYSSGKTGFLIIIFRPEKKQPFYCIQLELLFSLACSIGQMLLFSPSEVFIFFFN